MATTNSVPPSPAFRVDRRMRILLVGFFLLLFILPLFGRGIDLIVDWIWFKEQGFGDRTVPLLRRAFGESGSWGIHRCR